MPKRRKQDDDDRTITPRQLVADLIPALPARHQAVVATAGGTVLRWGECVGLRWDAVDLAGAELHVIRVAVEVAGTVTMKPFPKSRAGRRTVPLPPFVVMALTKHRDRFGTGPAGEVFANSAGGPLRRTQFRARIWRPALVRAGLLGSVREVAPDKWVSRWNDSAGIPWSLDFPTERQAVSHVARKAPGGLRFHDLRHSYATWLVSQGLPVNDIQRVLGHERASTTLDLYTHHSDNGSDAIRSALADESLTIEADDDPEEPDDDDEGAGAGP